jgi:hypothetical protein
MAIASFLAKIVSAAIATMILEAIDRRKGRAQQLLEGHRDA